MDLNIDLTSNGSTITFEAGNYMKVEDVLYQTQELSGQISTKEPQSKWILKINDGDSLDPDKLENIALLCCYTTS